MPKINKVEIASLPAVVVALQDFNHSAAKWFDGTPESIKERQQKVYALTNSCNSLLATSKLDDDDAALVDSWKMDLEKEAATLAESEFELAESRLQDDYEALPNFSVGASLMHDEPEYANWAEKAEVESNKANKSGNPKDHEAASKAHMYAQYSAPNEEQADYHRKKSMEHWDHVGKDNFSSEAASGPSRKTTPLWDDAFRKGEHAYNMAESGVNEKRMRAHQHAATAWQAHLDEDNPSGQARHSAERELHNHSQAVADLSMGNEPNYSPLKNYRGSFDWDKYIELEPAKFVQANADSTEDAEEIRYRAIREVLDKTADVEEPNRSYVVDTFVNRVEAARKSEVDNDNDVSSDNKYRTASVETTPDEWLLI